MIPEQQARGLLERIGIENAQSFSAGELVELSNLIADYNAAIIKQEFLISIYKRLQIDANRYCKLRDMANPGPTSKSGSLEAFVACNSLDHLLSEAEFDRIIDENDPT